MKENERTVSASLLALLRLSVDIPDDDDDRARALEQQFGYVSISQPTSRGEMRSTITMSPDGAIVGFIDGPLHSVTSNRYSCVSLRTQTTCAAQVVT